MLKWSVTTSTFKSQDELRASDHTGARGDVLDRPRSQVHSCTISRYLSRGFARRGGSLADCACDRHGSPPILQGTVHDSSTRLAPQSIPSPKGALPCRVVRESAYHRSQAGTVGRRASFNQLYSLRTPWRERVRCFKAGSRGWCDPGGACSVVAHLARAVRGRATRSNKTQARRGELSLSPLGDAADRPARARPVIALKPVRTEQAQTAGHAPHDAQAVWTGA
jgi:hypothetical protein